MKLNLLVTSIALGLSFNTSVLAQAEPIKTPTRLDPMVEQSLPQVPPQISPQSDAPLSGNSRPRPNLTCIQGNTPRPNMPPVPGNSRPRPDMTCVQGNNGRPEMPPPNAVKPQPNMPADLGQASTFQGVSRTMSFQEAVSDALRKAHQSMGGQDARLNFRVLDVQNMEPEQGQQDKQLIVTIQAWPVTNPSDPNLGSRPNLPRQQNNRPQPNIPPHVIQH